MTPLGAAASSAGCGRMPPPAPSSFSATDAGTQASCAVDLSWTDNSGKCLDQEDGFRIERKLQSEGSGEWSEISLSPADQDAESLTDTSVSEQTDYDYRIRSFNATGESSWVTESVSTGSCGGFE